MGLIYSNARHLLTAKKQGHDFGRVLTVGRQEIYLHPNEYRRLALEFPNEASALNALATTELEYADEFLGTVLGAESISAIDLSDYQGADIVHDLNLPISASLQESFDTVIDCGTLEHLFNTPVALRSLMEACRIGGYVFIATMANNHCGHGFYQFSPEFFFRVFSEANGFEVDTVLLVEHPYPGAELSERQRCFQVKNPTEVGGRIPLVGSRPTMIQALAKRIRKADIFDPPPQQSDYETLWKNSVSNSVAPPPLSQLRGKAWLRRVVGNSIRFVHSCLPSTVKSVLQGRSQLREYSFRNRKFYRPW